MDEKKLIKQAKQAANTFTALFFIQLFLQICLKGTLNDLWFLFFTLQIICYLRIYDIAMPPNTDIYITEITKMIEFEILHPDTVGKAVTGTNDFKTVDFLLNKGKDYAEKDAATIFEELFLIIIVVGVVLVLLVVVTIVALF